MRLGTDRYCLVERLLHTMTAQDMAETLFLHVIEIDLCSSSLDRFSRGNNRSPTLSYILVTHRLSVQLTYAGYLRQVVKAIEDVVIKAIRLITI